MIKKPKKAFVYNFIVFRTYDGFIPVEKAVERALAALGDIEGSTPTAAWTAEIAPGMPKPKSGTAISNTTCSATETSSALHPIALAINNIINNNKNNDGNDDGNGGIVSCYSYFNT